jgi:hypothetical protein
LNTSNCKFPKGEIPGRRWEDGEFRDIVQWIAKRWVCTRYAGGRIFLRDIGKQEIIDWIGSYYLGTDLEEYYHGKLYPRLWEELWPDKRTGDWKEVLRSFPLSGVTR